MTEIDLASDVGVSDKEDSKQIKTSKRARKRSKSKQPIMVAVDFSQDAEAAIVWASLHAAVVNAPLLILHVVHDPGYAPGFYRRKDKKDITKPMSDIAERMMDDFMSEMRTAHPGLKSLKKAPIKQVKGIPPGRIVEMAKKSDARLIVVGSSGRTGLAHILFGSVAERVAQLAPTPVVVVKRDPERELSEKPAEGPILVAVDFSDDSRAALLWASDYAAVHSSPLHVLHVVHDPGQYPGFYGKKQQDVTEPMEDAARRMMADFLEQTSEAHPELPALKSAKPLIIPGIPVTRILETAENDGASLIVMGSRGRTGLPHLLLGSKPEHVAQLSKLPVVILKGHPED